MASGNRPRLAPVGRWTRHVWVWKSTQRLVQSHQAGGKGGAILENAGGDGLDMHCGEDSGKGGHIELRALVDDVRRNSRGFHH